MKATFSQRLIKLADLNHHQTFFAGNIVTFESKVIAAGHSTLTVFTKAKGASCWTTGSNGIPWGWEVNEY